MKEFLLQYYYLITFGVEILAAVTGLLLYKKYKLTAAKYFIFFLVYLTICDFLGSYTKYINNGFLHFLKDTVFRKNYWWSTLFWGIGAIMFYSFYYCKILNNIIFKTIIKYSVNMFVTFSLGCIFLNWSDYFTRYFPLIDIFGAVIIFLCIVFYFMEMLQSDGILYFYKSINFYISVAIFIWWAIITPLVFYDIYNSNKDWNFILLKWQIYLIANLFMYLTFTFALIFCKAEIEIKTIDK